MSFICAQTPEILHSYNVTQRPRRKNVSPSETMRYSGFGDQPSSNASRALDGTREGRTSGGRAPPSTTPTGKSDSVAGFPAVASSRESEDGSQTIDFGRFPARRRYSRRRTKAREGN